jgi:hypothetical protein
MCVCVPVGNTKSQSDSREDLDRSCPDLDPRVWGSASVWYQILTMFVYCRWRKQEEEEYSDTHHLVSKSIKSSFLSVAEKRGTFLSDAAKKKR